MDLLTVTSYPPKPTQRLQLPQLRPGRTIDTDPVPRLPTNLSGVGSLQPLTPAGRTSTASTYTYTSFCLLQPANHQYPAAKVHISETSLALAVIITSVPHAVAVSSLVNQIALLLPHWSRKPFPVCRMFLTSVQCYGDNRAGLTVLPGVILCSGLIASAAAVLSKLLSESFIGRGSTLQARLSQL